MIASFPHSRPGWSPTAPGFQFFMIASQSTRKILYIFTSDFQFFMIASPWERHHRSGSGWSCFQFFMIASKPCWKITVVPRYPIFQFFMIASDWDITRTRRCSSIHWLSILYDCFPRVRWDQGCGGDGYFQFFMIASGRRVPLPRVRRGRLSILYDCFFTSANRQHHFTDHWLSILYDCF